MSAARLLIALCLTIAVHPALAQKKYDPGASDTEIKIGNTMPYSGPASAYGTLGKTAAAYFKKINDEGGVNGRKIVFISLDDGYSPPKTVEMVRRLVEQDEVLLMYGTVGTPTNSAVHKYLNTKKVPHLGVLSGAAKWNDPQNFPWTMPALVSYQTEAQVYARHILQTRPDAKIAVLYQNDDFGRDYLKGLKDGLGARSAKIVAEVSYEVSDPTVDSQIVQLRTSGADVFVSFTTAKFAAMAIRMVYDIGWKPTHYLAGVSVSVASVLTPAGLDRSVGIITSTWVKDPTDPAWADDPAMNEWRAFMKKHYPEGALNDGVNVVGYGIARMLVDQLRRCGDELTRENMLRVATSVKDYDSGINLPGIRVNTSPADYAPMKQLQLQRFDGHTWVRFGETIDTGVAVR